MSDKEKKEISPKIQRIIFNIHRAFMQPKKKLPDGTSLRKKYWLEVWSEIKTLSPNDLKELKSSITTIQTTLDKLKDKIDKLYTKKVKATAKTHSLYDVNQWEEDEFLDSSACLPVFKPQSSKKKKGKRWVITKPIEKPKTTFEICQAIWTVITNRAIFIVDKGKSNVEPSPSRDTLIEKHRLAVIPNFLDDKTITDPITKKPIMNIYKINIEVKETLLWLLAEKAKKEINFRKLYIKFLKKEIIGKAKLFEWAKKFSPLAKQILEEISI